MPNGVADGSNQNRTAAGLGRAVGEPENKRRPSARKGWGAGVLPYGPARPRPYWSRSCLPGCEFPMPDHPSCARALGVVVGQGLLTLSSWSLP
jgi:hypothetical protein